MGAGAELFPADIPLYNGAEDLAGRGVRSTIFPANRANAMPHIYAISETARSALLFDPQTCGGLLAALPQADAAPALDALLNAGYRAAVIGRVISGPPRIDLH